MTVGEDSGVQVRDATRADLDEIVAIYNSTIPEQAATADLVPVTAASRARWFEAHSPGRRPLWVAGGEGRVLAWVSFQDFYGRPAYAHTAELSIYVEAAARGQGLGRQLLRAAVDDAPRLGLKRLLAFIFGHNEASLALFRGAGFEPWGRLPGVARLRRGDADLVILGLAIGE